ncbi:aromatic ring-hydroxylating oxygenase subunit alpha [Sulfitobacter aestuariivivens]|uniref:Aromatic ring-hydroxylating dioxygenase subunit alpha n=1 Tax=Sulfitobacter aestuariivivens TaxID=2766981 RepID=A0A927D737_9RHOB|nr:aromatic ring-hydroxylating dioxygenase subunit alpha [Sulfitobacter aestuariivivens]MBD3666139.1 aromatic ring-hydroxylating dioxygenase subunit alpha [Sulfitobacter aestuariivivens]
MDIKTRDVSIPADWDRRGLPGWCYHSDALLDLEKEELFKTHWQIACHVSDLPNAGSFVSFDLCEERALVLRDASGELRAFHNICRHRGSRLVTKESGTCPNALICPFHGWVYNLDGSLRGPARPESFPSLDKDVFGLRPVEMEVWNGFIFLRFRPGPQPSVAEMLAPFEAEATAYRMASHVPTDGIWTEETPVNWKSVRDVDNEGYHVAMAHPALQDLYGSSYQDEPYVDGVSRTVGQFSPSKGRRWAVRNYKKLSRPQEHLPEDLHQKWLYFGIFPNSVIAMTPETVLFYQEFPVTVGRSTIRSATYRNRDEDRQQRAARYLTARIDRETVDEDIQLTIWSNESMASKSFEGFYLSDLEYGVRTHHNHLRKVLPVYTLEDAPEQADLAALNASMQRT